MERKCETAREMEKEEAIGEEEEKETKKEKEK